VKSDWRRWLTEAFTRGARTRSGPGPLVLRQLALAAIVLGIALLAGCRGDGSQYREFPQTTLEPTTDYGWKIQSLFELILWWSVPVFVLVEGGLLYLVWRFRARPGQPRPRQIHGSTKLEVAWTIAPALILVVIAVPTVQTIFDIGGPPPTDSLEVEVIGHQWWWEFRYPSLGIVTANEPHLPVGQNVGFDLRSDDVIHSFWFPRLGGKRDVVPNHVNRMWFMPETPDVYLGQCAEFCGTSHANMRMRAIADSPADWGSWVAAQQAPAMTTPEAARGVELFNTRGCIGCHNIVGVNAQTFQINAESGKIGPNLTHVGSRTTIAAGLFENNPTEMANWLRDPPAMKPGSLMPKLGLSEDDISALVAYLESLK
jgi:cytochrome c oxidase subunit II